MTRRILFPAVVPLLIASLGLPARAIGLSTGNVEWLGNIPIVTDGVGGRIVDGYFYVTDQNKLMIFDVANPLFPALVGMLANPQEPILGREDIDTNGEILLLPRTTPQSDAGLLSVDLQIVDVRNKREPRVVANVPGGGGHTVACAFDCTWSYSSDGPIVDLRDPEQPVLVNYASPGGHDIEEVAPGLLLAPGPSLWDVRADPSHPVRLVAPSTRQRNIAWHSLRWPREAQDRFVLGAGESNLSPSCRTDGGGFSTWDSTGWTQTGRFVLVDQHRLTNGSVVDGSPPRNVLGCSAHWFDAHPDFADGGIVALAAYEHGTRFLRVDGDGSIGEVGWFLPIGAETGAAYWVTDEILYAVDYARGLDILRFTG